MNQLLIIGARGFGRETYYTAMGSKGYGQEFVVKGFLDDKADALDGLGDYPPIIDSCEHYLPQEDDVFICALGNPVYRKKYVEMLLAKGAKFINLVSPFALINQSAKIGTGNIISGNVFVSADVEIGSFNVFQRDVIIGHDVRVGSYCEFGARSFAGGEAKIAEFVTLHTGSVVHPGVTVEEGATVGANSVAIRRVKANTTVFGVPAKKLDF